MRLPPRSSATSATSTGTVRTRTAPPTTTGSKAIANHKFRECLLYGLNLRTTWERVNQLEPLKCENNCFTMKGLCVFSDGRDYTDRVEELLNYPASNGKDPAV